MAKPIAVLYIPPEGAFHARGEEGRTILMRELNGNYGRPVDGTDKLTFPQFWTDYYWLVFEKHDIDQPELQVFYEKDFTPIKFEELKKFIEDTLKAEKTDA